MIPPGALRNPELLMVVSIISDRLDRDSKLFGNLLGLPLKAVVGPLEEQQPENTVLVVRRVDTSTELVRDRPQMFFENRERE